MWTVAVGAPLIGTRHDSQHGQDRERENEDDDDSVDEATR